jgi:hypothetical protein
MKLARRLHEISFEWRPFGPTEIVQVYSNEQTALRTTARQVERASNHIDSLKGQMTALKGMLMHLDAVTRDLGLTISRRRTAARR